jgi:hypothetical protein
MVNPFQILAIYTPKDAQQELHINVSNSIGKVKGHRVNAAWHFMLA